LSYRAVDDQASDAFARIGLGDAASDRPHWMFVKVPERKTVKNRVHVDFVSDNGAREVKRLLSLGATHVADIDEDGTAGPRSPILSATSSTSPATAATHPWQSSRLGSRRADDGNHPENNRCCRSDL
jgi:Glyoxalase-like domain